MNYLENIKNYTPTDAEEAVEKEVILAYLKEKGAEALYRRARLAHLTATAMVYNPSMDKILMIHHNIYDTWACVGGHADGMEDLIEVAKKELEEETGICVSRLITKEILSLDILQVVAHIKRGAYVPNHLHLNATYAFIVEEDLPLRIKADENSAVGWVPLGELKMRCKEDSFVKVYEKINKKLIK